MSSSDSDAGEEGRPSSSSLTSVTSISSSVESIDPAEEDARLDRPELGFDNLQRQQQAQTAGGNPGPSAQAMGGIPGPSAQAIRQIPGPSSQVARAVGGPPAQVMEDFDHRFAELLQGFGAQAIQVKEAAGGDLEMAAGDEEMAEPEAEDNEQQNAAGNQDAEDDDEGMGDLDADDDEGMGGGGGGGPNPDDDEGMGEPEPEQDEGMDDPEVEEEEDVGNAEPEGDEGMEDQDGDDEMGDAEAEDKDGPGAGDPDAEDQDGMGHQEQLQLWDIIENWDSESKKGEEDDEEISEDEDGICKAQLSCGPFHKCQKTKYHRERCGLGNCPYVRRYDRKCGHSSVELCALALDLPTCWSPCYTLRDCRHRCKRSCLGCDGRCQSLRCDKCQWKDHCEDNKIPLDLTGYDSDTSDGSEESEYPYMCLTPSDWEFYNSRENLSSVEFGDEFGVNFEPTADLIRNLFLIPEFV